MDGKEIKELVKPRDEKSRRETPLGIDAKKAVELNYKYNEEEKKILRKDRVLLEVTKDARYLKKGMYIHPSVAVGETMLAAKMAKKVTLKEDERIKNGKLVKIVKEEKK